MWHKTWYTKQAINDTSYVNSQIATEFGYSGSFFCQVQLFPANYSSKFKDRCCSEKKTSFHQVYLGTVFANLLSRSFMCIMLVMPK